MSTPMPACEALAADPARYIFKQLLSALKEAVLYDEKHHMISRIGGYLAALMECGVITVEQSRALRNETRVFMWGPAA